MTKLGVATGGLVESAAVSFRGIIRNRKIFIPAVIIGLNGVAWLVFGIHRRSAEPIKVRRPPFVYRDDRD